MLEHIRLLCFAEKNDSFFFDSFGVKYVPKEIKELVGHKNMKPNIFKVQASNSIMCGYFMCGWIYWFYVYK